MSCSKTLSGIASACDTSMGGVKKVWIANYGTFAPTVSGDTITSGTTEGFHYYYFKKNTANLASELTTDPANGVLFYTNTLSMVFSKMDTTKRIEISALAVADTDVIVQDANGKYWFITPDEPAVATSATAQTGTAKTDGNNYSISLASESNDLPMEITGTAVIEALEALA